jgi:hypothetical protein
MGLEEGGVQAVLDFVSQEDGMQDPYRKSTIWGS